MNGISGISGLTGGNCSLEEHEAYQRMEEEMMSEQEIRPPDPTLELAHVVEALIAIVGTCPDIPYALYAQLDDLRARTVQIEQIIIEQELQS